ncbi:tetratricopeptide repeat protein [Terribacillus saccharophilus]|uniref:tetratricopeptide repeat protein n=1 Tax=Terribacillus saccharophilus TaxID=361277 RepID=UPI002989A518|nr:tetratricopeptide repeat protein [Terribacillus saccharophilus]MCM3225823.1 tetratricopeptide repeat protein [Terribacillus saccharophilus]
MDSSLLVIDQDLTAALEEWYLHIRLGKRQEASDIYHDLSSRIADLKREDTLYIVYLLLSCRFHVLVSDLKKSKYYHEEAGKYKHAFVPALHYYYHLAEGMRLCEEMQYMCALASFEQAEVYLSSIDDEVEHGDFHFRKATTYFYLDISSLSVFHTEYAVKVFEKYPAYRYLLARSLLMRGLNFIDQKEFTQAENALNDALSHTDFKNEGALTALVQHNIGYLYTAQQMPLASIPYLTAARKYRTYSAYLNTLFLLADSYWKTGQQDKAIDAYQEGFGLSIEEKDDIFKWEFAMLHKKYVDRANFETVWTEGIEYFLKQGDKFNVRTYASELAAYFTETGQDDMAIYYYKLSLQS